MKFSHVQQAFDAIEQASSRLTITTILAKLLQEATAQEAKIIVYLSEGMLRPVYLGTRFNTAQKTLVSFLSDYLTVDSAQVEKAVARLGDMGSVYAQLCTAPATESADLMQVYDALVELEAISGSGSKEKRNAALAVLLQRLSPAEGKFILRMMVATLRLGFSEMTMVDALSWMFDGDKRHAEKIENFFNRCADLGNIAFLLKSQGLAALDAAVIVPGIPTRLAAAERMNSSQDIFDKLGQCYSHPKLDGFRLQVHKYQEDGVSIVKFFSRNLQEKSEVFPELTKAFMQVPADTFILEGEAICYNQQTGEFLPFQETAKRGRKHLEQGVVDEFPLRFFAFDIIYAQGEVWFEKTHEERRQRLTALLAGSSEVIAVIDEVVCHTAEDIEHSFDLAISEGLEGIVVKKRGMPYTPGKRSFNWIKFKRKESTGLADTIDAVIIGYYHGRGKRSQFGIGAVLLAIFDEKTATYQSIAKCGSGPTEQEWMALKKECDLLHRTQLPHDVVVAKELIPDVIVQPKIVVVVRADEITRSPLHSAGKTAHQSGYALRFPRIIQRRDDKMPEQTTSVQEITRLVKLASGRHE